MAHGAKQPRWSRDFAWQRLVSEQTAEQAFGRGSDRGKPGGEVIRGGSVHGGHC